MSRIGARRHWVVVERPVRSQNETGEEEIVPAFYGRFWALIEPISGRERLMRREINAEMDTKFTFRWSPALEALDATWRFQHRGVIYNIVSPVNMDMANKEIEVFAGSGVNRG